MKTVTISALPKASDAVEWCNNQFGDSWKLYPKNILSDYPRYEFRFENEQDAVLFSLKWL